MMTVLGYMALLLACGLVVKYSLPKRDPHCPGCRHAALANQNLRCVAGGLSPPLAVCPEHG